MDFVEHKSLAEARWAVECEVEYIQKKGKVAGSGGGYTVATESDVIAALRPSMLRHRIVGPEDICCELLAQDEYDTARGTRMSRVRVKRRWRFIHIDSGDEGFHETFGEATDAGDKALAKCMTIAKKYALREYFNIETGDDPDLVRRERDAPNAEFIERACQRLQSAASEKEIAEHMTRFGKAKEQAGWTEEQWAALEKMADERTRALRGAKK